ncbi:MAG: hypothetical protein QOH45_3532, partial [Pseudonocardiales bacterium]|nr:hypothetical protein [Pseudonocardiales bacterium]
MGQSERMSEPASESAAQSESVARSER